MCCAAMLPPAPAWFSTTPGWPMFSVSFFATIRAAVSVPPPGAKPTVSVTGRDGNPDWANAEAARAAPARPRKIRLVAFMEVSPAAGLLAPCIQSYTMDLSRKWDVLVLGGGNAALCAAITAREAGASVLLADAAPAHFRGGTTRHTRNLRCMHDAPAAVLTTAYPAEENC